MEHKNKPQNFSLQSFKYDITQTRHLDKNKTTNVHIEQHPSPKSLEISYTL